jgi:3-methyladenine DNA glycosylase/8-oxoguanine DNA glycosylase
MPQRTLTVTGPFDLRATFGALITKPVGALNKEPGVVWWVTHADSGPASLRLEQRGATVHAQAWGGGGEATIEAVPDLIGLADDPTSFEPVAGLVRDLHRRRLGLRLGKTGKVFETLLPTILGQRVTTKEAERSYRAIVRKYGSPAPGPLQAWVPPQAAIIAQLTYAELHPCGVERSRAMHLIEAARRAGRLEHVVTMSPDAAVARLTAVRGIGPWTAAQVLGSAMGDPDAIPLGDYHIPNMVSWALAGEPRADDARMLELLEPYRGHRRRVLLLLKGARIAAPKYGPKSATHDFRGR